MITCTCCKGSKEQHVMSRTFTDTGWTPGNWVAVPCVWCKGTGKMTAEQAKLHKDCLRLETR